MRPEFEKAGARLAIVSAIETGADEFIDKVWPGGELYFDDEEAFKKALGQTTYRTWWLLRPSVMRNIVSFAGSFGSSQADVTDKKTQLLGGTFVVKNGEVVYTHRETSTFDNGNARELLAAVLGKPGSELKNLPTTPAQGEVCTRETADACS